MADVVVVGASISGAATALHLARMGYSVQVLEAAHFPRRKPCGEGISPHGAAELERLGVLPALLPSAAVLTALQFEMEGRTVDAPLGSKDRPALGIERLRLDAGLAEVVSRAGVEVCYGVRATGLVSGPAGYEAVETVQGRIPARVIVAADGAGSRLRHAAGLDAPPRSKRYGASAHYRLGGPASQRIEVHFRRGHEVYVTPVGGSVVNVAVLLSSSQAGTLGGRLREGYEAYVRDSHALPGGAELIDEPLLAGPFPASVKRYLRDNLVLAGDAAGFFDGITGEGISLALTGARSCAEAVHRYLDGGGIKAFEAYERRQRDGARNPALLARLVLFLAARPALGQRVIGNLARQPATFAKLVAINQGERDLGSLRPRDLLALLAGV